MPRVQPNPDQRPGKKGSKPTSKNAPPKGLPAQPGPLPPPPVGTYDPALDYQAGAANRGFSQLGNDAQTAFEQGKENYGLDLGDLTRGRDYRLADLLTGENRLNQDYGIQTADLARSFGILGRQQAERAAQQGVTSAGLLGKSAQIRAANQAHDQAALDLARNRGLEDIGTDRARTNTAFDQGKLRLDLNQARQFGGFNGETLLNPLTGKPEFGSLLTSVTRAGAENSFYQGALGRQMAGQAQANGYIAPPEGVTATPDYLKKAQTLKSILGLR